MKPLIKVSVLLISIFLISGCSKQEKISLVKRGKTVYLIYLDTSAPESVKIAAEDLKSYFTKVTGASISIVINEQPPVTPFISLGSTAAAKDEKLDISGIPYDGYRIVTRGSNLFILGPDTPDGEVNKRGGINKGTSNGVYTFIEDYLGVKWLMPGEIGEEYEEFKTLRIPSLDRTEYSPFDYRDLTGRDTGEPEMEWNRCLKLGIVSAVEAVENWIETVPPSLYDKHPEWYAMKDGKRIPPIGPFYKLESTNKELIQYYADRIIEAFRKDPKRRWYSVSPSDASGYSESPESLALTELDPNGKKSVSPLIFTFYNDVARIVRKEFPDHMLGGLIYDLYHYPPNFKMESNLALMLPTSTVSGFVLYRPSWRNWTTKVWVPEWSEISKRDGFDLYYYCFPTWLSLHNGTITPPAPDILNIVFSDMINYGFKGIYFYGNPIWPAYGPGNYATAKMFWNPIQDAHKILHEYYLSAYGKKALPYMEKFYLVLDTAFAGYYNRNMKASWQFTEEHLQRIYAPNYRELEKNYLEALSVEKKPIQQQRLELIGQVLSLLQWNLRDHGYLPEDFKTPLTVNDEQADSLLNNQKDDCRITMRIPYKPLKMKVEVMPALKDATGKKEAIVPVNRDVQMLLHITTDGEVNIFIKTLKKRAEFVQYSLTDAKGKKVLTGALSEGRTIRFKGNAGENYFLYIPSERGTLTRMKIEGASVAYYIPSLGFQLEGNYMDEFSSLYFYVPKAIKSFNLTLGRSGNIADIFSPDGRKIGQLDNTTVNASNILVTGANVKEGFWKITFHPIKGIASITLDEQLPQWFIADPAVPLKIIPE